MKTIARIFGILSLIVLYIGFAPFLGWLNWFGFPLEILGLIFSIIGKSHGGKTICAVSIIVGMLRLIM